MYNKNQFAGRDCFMKLLQEAVYNAHSPNTPKVLAIYGAGGQGKSALKEHFINWIEEVAKANIISTAHAELDFEHVSSHRQADTGLLHLAEQLITKHKVPLPCFSLGVLLFKKLVYPEKNIENTYPFLFRIKALKSDISQELVDIVAETTNIVGMGALLKKATSKLQAWLNRRDVNKLIGNLGDLSAGELLEHLPYLLAFDVSQEIERLRKSGKDKRFVFVIDGYESLWKGEINHWRDADEWVRKFALNLPGALFVIFGRDRLKWAAIENDSDIDAFTQQVLLYGLEDKDAEQYLRNVPIPEKEVRETIIASSKSKTRSEEGCLPFYLALQVETYTGIRKKGKPISKANFGGSKERILNHFLEHLDGSIGKALKVLAVPNVINEDIIEALVRGYYISPEVVTLGELRNYSFIYSSSDTLTMHSLMQELCRQQLNQETPQKYRRINETLFEYFDNNLSALEREFTSNITSAEWEQCLEQAAFHKALCQPEQLADWILNKTAQASTRSNWKVIPNILYAAVAIEKTPIKKAQLLMRLAELFGQINNYKNKKECLTTAIDLCEKYLSWLEANTEGKGPELQGQKQEVIEILGTCYLEIAVTSADNDDLLAADIEYNRARNWCDDHRLWFNPHPYAVFLMRLGRVADAESVLTDLYNNYSSQAEKWDQGIAAHDLSKILLRQERYKEAKHYSSEALKIVESIKGTSSVDFSKVQLMMASILTSEAKELGEAKKLVRECKKIFDEAFPETDWHHYYIHNALGDIYRQEGNTLASLDEYQKAMAFLKSSPNDERSKEHEILFDCAEITFNEFVSSGQGSIRYEAYCYKFLAYMATTFLSIKNSMGIFSPSFRKGIKLYELISEHTGDAVSAQSMQRLRLEFDRILMQQSRVRIDGLQCSILSEHANQAFLDCIRNLTSLPQDASELETTCIDLPFYNAYKLYQVRYKNARPWYAKYIMTNGELFFVLNRKNTFIYECNKDDLNVNENNIASYIRFFFDLVPFQQGSFYPVKSATELPWRLDVPPLEGVYEYLKKIIGTFPVKMEEDTFTTKSWMVHMDGLYLTDIKIERANGYVDLSIDHRLELFRDENGMLYHQLGSITSYEQEISRLEPVSLNISIAPQYDRAVGKEDGPYILRERIEVRTNEFTPALNAPSISTDIYNRLRILSPLPDLSDQVIVTAYNLPFYQSTKLFKVTINDSQKPIYHYFVGNEEDMKPFSWTNNVLYQLGESDLVLSSKTAVSYMKFFFDSVMGMHGRFYILNGPDDIPWTDKANVDGSLEKCIISTVEKIRFIEDQDGVQVFEAYIIFKKSLFLAEVYVTTANGQMRINNERLIVFAPDHKGGYFPVVHEDEAENDSNNVEKLPVQEDAMVPFGREIRDSLVILKYFQLYCQICGEAVLREAVNTTVTSISQYGITQQNKSELMRLLKEFKKQVEKKLPGYIEVLGSRDSFISILQGHINDVNELVGNITDEFNKN